MCHSVINANLKDHINSRIHGDCYVYVSDLDSAAWELTRFARGRPSLIDGELWSAVHRHFKEYQNAKRNS